jgi:hypothetical protein
VLAGGHVQVDDKAFARGLAREWLAIGAAETDPRTFTALCLAFAAVLWGALIRGAFFRTDLIGFVVLAGAAAIVVPGAKQALLGTRWLVASAGSMVLAVVVSALDRGQLGALWWPLAVIGAATALAVVGISVSQRAERVVLIRAVVDTALITAVLGLVGVAWHLPALAELQAEGWRASARIGYANATGVVLALGLLCACWLAYLSASLADRARASLIMTGLLATQSRGALVGVAACWLVWFVWHRAGARILAQTAAWSLVAFIGTVPAVERTGPQPLFVLAGVVIAVALLVATGRGMAETDVRILATAVGWSAAATTFVLLNSRVVDSGSDTGRLRLWHEAIRHLHVTGVFGAGPSQIATFSTGGINQLFIHNDLLQIAQYYGLLGVLALAVAGGSLALALFPGRHALRPARGSGPVTAWVLGLGALIILVCDALVDFAMEIPIITAMVSLVLGLTVGSGRHVGPESSPGPAQDHIREGNAP